MSSILENGKELWGFGLLALVFCTLIIVTVRNLPSFLQRFSLDKAVDEEALRLVKAMLISSGIIFGLGVVSLHIVLLGFGLLSEILN